MHIQPVATGELGVWKWISSQIRECDWAALNHNRRKIYPKVGIQVAAPMQFQCSLLQQISYYHSNKLATALASTLPQNELNVLSGQILVPYCIWSAPHSVIKNWVEFVEDRTIAVLNKLGCGSDPNEIMEFVKNDSSFTTGGEGKNCDWKYQSRVGGFIAERMNTIFWMLNNVAKQWQNVILLESRTKNIRVNLVKVIYNNSGECATLNSTR